MSSKLEKLIAAYEAECASLTAEMEECVAELEYGRANSFFKALGHVSQQLQTLYSIQDKWHDEKERLSRSIKFLEERITGEEEHLRRFFTERVAKDKEKLAELNQAPTQKPTDGYTVRNILSKVLAEEITGFTLVFQESKRLSCHIRLARRTLILTISEIRRHRSDDTLRKWHSRKLKDLGFRFYDNKDKLMLFAPYSVVEDIKVVQLLLARITFDVFYFKEFADETFIKYCS